VECSDRAGSRFGAAIVSPRFLVVDGKPQLGIFDDAIDVINAQDCDLRTPMNKKASCWQRHFGYKRFQYFGAISEQIIFGCAMVDLRYLGMAFVYIYRPSDGAMRQWRIKLPLAWRMNLSDSPVIGHSNFRFGNTFIDMTYDDRVMGSSHEKRLRVKIGNELTIDASLCEPVAYPRLALCTPIASNGWVYAQKTAGVPVSGKVRCSLGDFDLEAIHCHGHHDFSAGYMRHDTFWQWACLSGLTHAGESLGLNISWGVNETGWSENCVWFNHQRFALSQAQFDFNRDDEKSTWHITSSSGDIELRFTPAGCFSEDINAWVLASRFKQFFGRFDGSIAVGGKRVDVKNMWGFVEDQFSRW